jgi:hypothetical protein
VPANAEQAAVLELHRGLVALRRERPWLTAARLEVVTRATAHLEYRVWAGDRALVVGLNLGTTAVPVRSAGPDWRCLAGGPNGAVPPGAFAIFESRGG